MIFLDQPQFFDHADLSHILEAVDPEFLQIVPVYYQSLEVGLAELHHQVPHILACHCAQVSRTRMKEKA